MLWSHTILLSQGICISFEWCPTLCSVRLWLVSQFYKHHLKTPILLDLVLQDPYLQAVNDDKYFCVRGQSPIYEFFPSPTIYTADEHAYVSLSSVVYSF